MRSRRRLPVAALAGAVAAAGLEPFGLWPLTVLALACVPWLLGDLDARGGAWTGWAFGTGYFALALIWIVEPFLVDAARHGWMAPFGLFFMSGGLALFWALAFGLASWLAQSAGLRLVALIVTWTLAEFARTYVLTGFPWGAPGQVWVGTPVALLLAWIGPQGLNGATFAAALPLGLLISQKFRPMLVLPAVLLAAVAYLQRPPAMTDSVSPVIRLIQPNAPQHLKWHPDHMPGFYQRQLEFTAAAAPPDLVVWPEASLAYIPGIEDPLADIANAARGAQVVLGTLRPGADGVYNAALRIDGKGAVDGIYDKHHLVPFGEYLPFEGLVTRLGLQSLAAVVPGGMSAGSGPALLDLGPVGHALPLICYEAVFPQDVNRAPGRADLLLQITNDAWFGDWAGPYQHLAQARMRAIEQGLPMVRAANTGISALIDPYGRILASLPLGTAGFVDSPLPAPLAPTLYAQSGDFPIFVLFVFLLAGFFSWNIIHNRIR